MPKSATGSYKSKNGSYMKDVRGMVTQGVNKIMSQYRAIKREVNPNIFGQAAGAIRRATQPTTRSGAPAPNKYKPLK